MEDVILYSSFMSSDEKHKLAMELASKPDVAKIEGNDEMYAAYIGWALEFEKCAAYSLWSKKDFEPTRSVFFRSAASLALESGNIDEAVVLANSGLSGNPPDIIE